MEKIVLEKLCFDLKMGRFCTLLVVYGLHLTGITWKKYSDAGF